MNPYGFVGGSVDRNALEASGGFIRSMPTDHSTVLGQDYTLDPSLAVTGRHPDTQELIVIPRGKILTIATTDLTATPATISICDASAKPVGISRVPYMRQRYYSMANPVPAPLRNVQITMPYIAAVNDGAGTLGPGCWLKSDATGNFVIWTSGSDSPELAVGRLDVIDLRNGATPGWLKWVRTAFPDWAEGLAFPANYTTSVTADGNELTAVATTTSTVSWQGTTVTLGQTPASSLHAVYSASGNKKYLLSKSRLNINTPITVWVAGVTMDKEDLAGVSGHGDGYAYVVDTVNGFILFATAVATTATVQASYAYEADYTLGTNFGAGIAGLTDGLTSGLGAGVEPWIDQLGSTGKMLITLF